MKDMKFWILPVLLPLVGYPAIAATLIIPGELHPLVSLLIATLMIFYVWLVIRSVEASSERRWEQGARGEILVGKELEKLHRDGFYVFHDYYSKGRGNVDHFAVGPLGIFVIETKAVRGEITVRDGQFLQKGRPLAKDAIRQVRGEARDVSQLIKDTCGVGYWVHPIVCFSHADLRHYGPVQGVETATVGSLCNAIMRHPRRRSPENSLSSSEVRAVVGRIENYLDEAPAAGPDSPPLAPGRLHRMSAERLTAILAAGYLVVVSLIFTGTTIEVLEGFVVLYKVVALLKSALWSLFF